MVQQGEQACAQPGVVPTSELAEALRQPRRRPGGWNGLTELIYNTTASVNGFDKYGHFGRTLVTLTNCLDYEAEPAGTVGCDANFNGPTPAKRRKRGAPTR